MKYLLSIFPVVIGLVFIVSGIIITANKTSKLSRLKEFGIPAQGTISDVQIVGFIDSPTYSFFINFTTKNGDHITGVQLDFYSSNMHIGDTVKIWYDPENPYDVATESEPLWLFLFIFGIVGSASLCLGVLNCAFLLSDFTKVNKLQVTSYKLQVK